MFSIVDTVICSFSVIKLVMIIIIDSDTSTVRIGFQNRIFFVPVVVVNETVAAVDQLLPVIDSRHVHKDVYQVKVTCSQIGETRVEYRVGNVATSTNANPVEALTYISVSNYLLNHPSRTCK